MSNAKTYLFTFTITPVQSFISQARKTKDLFAGSAILSDLMRALIQEALEEGSTIILPQDECIVSNKILLKIEDENKVKSLGERLEKYVVNEAVIRDFFDLFWVAEELGEEYSASYKKLEHNLGAIKNLRSFKQISQESGRKCSLCGERNGLYYNSDKRPKYIVKKAIRVADTQIKENETVCLICYTKRKYEINNVDKEKFLSLADIVTFDQKDNLNGEDAEIFLKNHLSEKRHYALLHFDVDDMGKTLHTLEEAGQKMLSNALGEFSLSAKEIVDRGGKTIYAGGDDFLGLVNLASLFEVVGEIEAKFGEATQSLPYTLTYSTALIIAHYKTPLHKVLDYSRSLLDETKKHFEDKNGVGVMVMSSNAIISKTLCKYDSFQLLKAFRNNGSGTNLYSKLHTIFDYLDTMSYDEMLLQKAMIATETKRLLKREEGAFDPELYNQLIGFLDKQIKERTSNSYDINFDNFIGYLKTLEQCTKVM